MCVGGGEEVKYQYIHHQCVRMVSKRVLYRYVWVCMYVGVDGTSIPSSPVYVHVCL